MKNNINYIYENTQIILVVGWCTVDDVLDIVFFFLYNLDIVFLFVLIEFS